MLLAPKLLHRLRPVPPIKGGEALTRDRNP